MFRFPSIYRIAQIVLDAIAAIAAVLLAFSIRFEGQIPAEYWPLIRSILIFGLPCRLFIQWLFRVYRQIWRLFSLRDFWAIFQAVSFYSLLLIFATRLLLPKVVNIPALPLGVAVIDWGFCIAGMTGIRFLRTYQVRVSLPTSSLSSQTAKRILLLGAGRAGAQITREIRHNPHLQWQIVGFLDDDTSKLKRQVEGVPVAGTVNQLVSWAQRLAVDTVLITMPSAPSDRIQQIVNLAKAEDIPIKILPRVQELLRDRTLAGQIRDIRLEDLLGRPEIFLDFDQTLVPDFPSATAQIRDRIVLVTGAGGTIGSELCRQIARLNPRQLVLVGRGENSIFHIDQELRRTFPGLNPIPVIADIRHQKRISQVFHDYYPDVVFHAAAHKHVPLMEQNPTEAIENNTIASANLATLAEKVGVSTFVLISTDKAVAPSNFMGLSKRLAELLVSEIARQGQTRFLSVRFGNVLGSRGSVVPIFQSQISKGGPITVTDPTMTRYFMTTPEATRLVVQSLAVGRSGQILVLDMGNPMKIYDLAEQLIRLEGYVPGCDIEIKITGIRPGEKLHESLYGQNETLTETPHPKIFNLLQQINQPLSPQQVILATQDALTAANDKKIWQNLSHILRSFHAEASISLQYLKKCDHNEPES